MLEELPEALRARVASSPGAEARLTAMLAEARSAHPQLAMSPALFAAYALERVPSEGDTATHLAGMRAADLLLAAACARGDATAIGLFEKRCFDEISFAHARVKPPATIDEIAQMMRDRLFVRTPDAPPAITQYGAIGDLRSWFRVVLLRHLLNFTMRAPRETPLDDAMLEMLPGAATDPELEHARRLYGPMLKAALVESIAALEQRERTLLRLAVCDGLTSDAIGELYAVHRATAARWVASARQSLESGVRERLRNRIGGGDASLASLFRLLASQVDISLRGHLVTGAGDKPATKA